MKIEIFKPINGFEDYYEVSNMGFIKGLPRGRQVYGKGTTIMPERIVKGSKDKEGYIQISLSAPNKLVKLKVHRLVALAFIPNPENKPEVNHLDFDRSNNKASNLVWATRIENQKHSWDAGRLNKGEKVPNAIPVLDLQTGIYYSTVREAAQAKCINYGTLKIFLRKKKIYRSLSYA